MNTLVLLVLLLLPLQQQNKPETVPLVFGPTQAVIMRTVKAEKLYSKLKLKIEKNRATAEDKRLFAVLTQALGTIPDREAAPLLNTRDRLDWEIRRGVRTPLQKPEN